MIINQAIQEFMEMVQATKSKGTISFYNHYCDKINSYFGKMDSETIEKRHIIGFIQSEKQSNDQISNSTLNKSIQTLKTVVKYTTGRKIEFQKLKERRKMIFTIPQQTINKIFDYYENSIHKSELRNYAYVRLLYDTGLRLSEINNLQIHNVIWDLNIIHVTITKTDLDRYVVFTDKTKSVLLQYVTIFQPHDLLFYQLKSERNGQILSTTSVEKFISRLKLKLNIKDNITPHKWRHTFATRFLRGGGDLETLRLLLGHTNLKTTQKYLHMNRNDLIKNYIEVFK